MVKNKKTIAYNMKIVA